MDPVTHAVIGAAIGKAAGLNLSLQDGASLAMIVGAVFPDSDIILQYRGDFTYLKNHRGATHSLVGLAASALLIGFTLSMFYSVYNPLHLILWALAGGVTHMFFDILNSYGAKLLWPIKNKKYSLSLLVLFDPILIGFFLGCLFAPAGLDKLFFFSSGLYLISRVWMRLRVKTDLIRQFGDQCSRISLLPSMTGIFRWHFVVEDNRFHIIGEKSIFGKGIKIFRKLEKIEDDLFRQAMNTGVGRFFREFTPIFHVANHKVDGVVTLILTDLRYFLNNKFLHHAIIKFDESYNTEEESFRPYRMDRIVEVLKS